MKARFLFLIMVSFVVLWSCEPNEPDSVLINNAPVVPSQTFTVPENFPDGQLIGKIQATDKDEDALEFSLIQESSGLFEVTQNGNLFLVAGKTLSFAVQEEYVLDVYVHDGVVGRKGSVTVKVTLPENLAPIAEDTIFDDIIETLPEGELIGNLEATDPEGEPLTYEIIEDEDGLFAVTGNGEIVLAEGQSLDFETAEQHTIVVSINDGVNEVQITVTINVMDDGDIFDDPTSFITTWNMETDGQELIIGTNPDFSYDYTIDWGDGTQEQRTDENPSHIYQTAGNYTVAINGQFPAIMMSESDEQSREALVDVVQWGSQEWQSMEYAFFQCNNLESFSAIDRPKLSQVDSMFYMFEGAIVFNDDIGNWDVSQVTNMSGVFYNANSFNGDISEWDVSKVTAMDHMFNGALTFNVDISNWVTSEVTVMNEMFYNAESFNQNISSWNVSNVTIMSSMFSDAISFDQDLGAWVISSITQMGSMFNNSGMSNTNYSATLRGWASLGDDNIPDGISLGAGSIPYCNDFDTAFAREVVLANNNGWTITDGGAAPCN
jgi:surface protein